MTRLALSVTVALTLPASNAHRKYMNNDNLYNNYAILDHWFHFLLDVLQTFTTTPLASRACVTPQELFPSQAIHWEDVVHSMMALLFVNVKRTLKDTSVTVVNLDSLNSLKTTHKDVEVSKQPLVILPSMPAVKVSLQSLY